MSSNQSSSARLSPSLSNFYFRQLPFLRPPRCPIFITHHRFCSQSTWVFWGFPPHSMFPLNTDTEEQLQRYSQTLHQFSFSSFSRTKPLSFLSPFSLPLSLF
ncbi:hypothetical protein Ancab_023227 [Ancistrocladus abbreviatus]